jgi:hypothetical protein
MPVGRISTRQCEGRLERVLLSSNEVRTGTLPLSCSNAFLTTQLACSSIPYCRYLPAATSSRGDPADPGLRMRAVQAIPSSRREAKNHITLAVKDCLRERAPEAINMQSDARSEVDPPVQSDLRRGAWLKELRLSSPARLRASAIPNHPTLRTGSGRLPRCAARRWCSWWLD